MISLSPRRRPECGGDHHLPDATRANLASLTAILTGSGLKSLLALVGESDGA